MSDFGPDFGSDFGGSANPAPYQAQLRYNIPIVSPQGSVALVGTNGITLIGTNRVRRGLIFWNPSSVIIYVFPGNQGPVAGWGTPIYPQNSLQFINDPEANISCGTSWSAITATGNNNPLVILELL
jgi:hypothetical protein